MRYCGEDPSEQESELNLAIARIEEANQIPDLGS
jgi:hypothetical protein